MAAFWKRFGLLKTAYGLLLWMLFVTMFFCEAQPVCAEDVTAAQLLPAVTEVNADGTVTLYVVIDGSIQSYDFGVAFSLDEAEVSDYGFVQAFSKACMDVNGVTVSHYFTEGDRISETHRYIVFGGMANAGATYQGSIAYVTFALKETEATVYVVKDSASYEYVDEMMADGTAYTLTASSPETAEPAASEAASDADVSGADTGETSNSDGISGADASSAGTNGTSGSDGTGGDTGETSGSGTSAQSSDDAVSGSTAGADSAAQSAAQASQTAKTSDAVCAAQLVGLLFMLLTGGYALFFTMICVEVQNTQCYNEDTRVKKS